ncbi:TolC family protein [Hymenobacter yonginensis]|uniref:TolC family protein n=1 Tax=Hymenobacter yonginensis TaxID=748197 RepID=A0ABY7PPY6_9BACT|nr:TolC family protein [Hymenobacter yonginensis]WBO84841.1 TolC family protein [Hymenobacter yonginensis]
MTHLHQALRLLLGFLWLAPSVALAQSAPPSQPTNQVFTLDQCLNVALANQPVVRQARIDQEIAQANNQVALAGWLPQVGVQGTAQHYFQLPFTIFPDPTTGTLTPRQIGVRNVTTVGLSGTQVIYNNDVYLAARSKRFNNQAATQNTVNVKIATVSDVSKGFYDVLLAQRQLEVFSQDIARLQRNYRDARARYETGIADKTEYLQAEISLNNSLTGRKQAQEAIKARLAYLKQLMGLPPERPLALQYDTLKLELAATMDTAVALNINNRIEIQQLQTQKSLQDITVDYYRLGFLPSLSAFGNYNSVFQNNSASDLYRTRFPNSYAGLQLGLPLFTGFRRTQNLRRARLENTRLDEDVSNTRNQINTEYATALANYKGYYTQYMLGKRNLEASKEVYEVINLQYREGIRAYIDLIVAQTTLRTSQLNYYTALFQLLSSKVDLLRALGELPTEY